MARATWPIRREISPRLAMRSFRNMRGRGKVDDGPRADKDDAPDMQTFVTGGSGFVGRTLIRVLREKGHEVRALARSDPAVQAVRAAGAEAVRGDLGDPAAMREGMTGCQWVFHSAALASAWGPRQDFIEAN